MMLLITIFIFLYIKHLNKNHSWKYRNPYARKCKKCSRIENYFVFDIEGARHQSGEWEEMYPLAKNKKS